MTKFKKCDDCGIAFGRGTRHKVKTKGGFGQSKAKVDAPGGAMMRESPVVLFLCDDCYNFHEADNKDSSDDESSFIYEDKVKEGSSLDRLIAKKSKGSWSKEEIKLPDELK